MKRTPISCNSLSFVTIIMFQHNCLDTYCFECLICVCCVFLYLHCSAQLSMFHMERRSRNMLIIIIIINDYAKGRGRLKD